MQFKERETGYTWTYVNFLGGTTVILHNKHEDREIQVHRDEMKERFKQVIPRDRNGFKIDISTKGWKHE